MINESITLKDVFPKLKTNGKLVSYVRSNFNEIDADIRRKSVLICPGGGYYFTSKREAEPIALAFLARGFNAFVLYYDTNEGKTRYPAHLLEASAALAYIRRNAEHYNAYENNIAVLGFSAGGHLAASLGTLWNEGFIDDTLALKHGENRPDGMILCYPVITSGEFAHKGSFDALLGDEKSAELMHKLSLENSVGAHTPPAFIWHTLNDGGVPSENSFLFAAALRKNNIPFELHIYPDGVHGLSLGTRETKAAGNDALINEHVTSWIDLCSAWVERYL